MASPAAPTCFVTGSRRGDLLVFAGLALLIVAGGARLRVYYTVAGARVEAAVVAADGGRRALEVPGKLARAGSAAFPMEAVLERTERRVRAHAASQLAGLPRGSHLEYTIHYGVDSVELRERRELRAMADGALE